MLELYNPLYNIIRLIINMEPVTIVIVSYSITIVTTIVSSYYVSSYLGDKVYDEIGKLRSVVHIFI
jgi:hypothetical protein